MPAVGRGAQLDPSTSGSPRMRPVRAFVATYSAAQLNAGSDHVTDDGMVL